MDYLEKEIFNQTVRALNYRPKQIESTLDMLADGSTIPFIARYRKEKTGSLDEVQLREIQATYLQIEKLTKRKKDVITKIEEQGKITDSLRAKILQSQTLQDVEDLYLPYKQKRRTKAQIARENGLEPLAKAITAFADDKKLSQICDEVLSDKVPTIDEALAGASEILAEAFSENARLRSWVRRKAEQIGLVVAELKDETKDENQVYQDYYEFSESVKKIAAHRILAIDRGEKNGVLRVKVTIDEAYALQYFHSLFIANQPTSYQTTQLVEKAYTEAYKRFIKPAIEREIRKNLTEKAATQAISVFGENLYHLLMQAPLKGKVVLGLDPAYRTGCKLAVVDKTGKFLDKSVIYPHEKHKGAKVDPKLRAQAVATLKALIKKYNVEMIAIGNGTASRESEQFVADVLKDVEQKVFYIIVNEAGASVYSASTVARKEFPDFNVEERSAVSIARRLQDPLAELIKIDPKAIGVGQYQHDLPEKQLDEKLSTVIETSVNQVGVNLNTASPELLEHISGLNKTIAQNIVLYRNENGQFMKREQLKKVARLGPKAYEQAAGFLRIVGGENILDNTDIHPESYQVTQKLFDMVDLKRADIGTKQVKTKLAAKDLSEFANQLGIGFETIQDIVASLEKPGRDLRDEMPSPLLRTDVLKIEDLKNGMQLQGTVRNVVDFGAFVDIGVKQDGLVHISRLSTKFISSPSEVVAVGDIVTVWIESVDLKRNRIQLTMLEPKKSGN